MLLTLVYLKIHPINAFFKLNNHSIKKNVLKQPFKKYQMKNKLEQK